MLGYISKVLPYRKFANQLGRITDSSKKKYNGSDLVQSYSRAFFNIVAVSKSRHEDSTYSLLYYILQTRIVLTNSWIHKIEPKVIYTFSLGDLIYRLALTL